MDRGRKRSKPMVIAGVVLLVVSHGVALWLGFAAAAGGRRSEDGSRKSDGGGAASASAEAESKAAAERRAYIADLRGRGLERVAADDRKGGELEEREHHWARFVNEARAKIPADADVRALLEKGMAESAGTDLVKVETVAAFGVWMDRDVTAALAWLAAAAPYRELNGFNCELQRWLGAGAHAQLPALLDRYPALAEDLLDAARGMAWDRGAEFNFALARSLPVPGERAGLLEQAMADVDFVKSHLAELQPFLDEALTHRLLDIMMESGPQGEMEAAMRSAGLAESLILGYQQRIESPVDTPEENAAAVQREAGGVEAQPSLEDRITGLASVNASWNRDVWGLDQALPDYELWCAEMQDGRMSADDVVERMKAAWPAAAGLEPAIRTLVFRESFAVDPVAALKWYRAGGGDPAGQIDGGVTRLRAEQIVKLIESVPDLPDLTSKRFYEGSRNMFEAWHNVDPAGCNEALARLKIDGVTGQLKPAEFEEEPTPAADLGSELETGKEEGE